MARDTRRISALFCASALALAPTLAVAQTKVGNLPAASSVTSTDVFPASQGCSAAPPTAGCTTTAGVTGSQLARFGAGSTAHGLVVGQNGSASTNVAAMSAGQIAVGQGSSSDPVAKTVSGDATLSSGGSLVVTKTNGAPFGLVQLGSLVGANMNSTADQSIALTCPALHCLIAFATVTNASGSLASAQGTLFAATGGTSPLSPSGLTTSSWAGFTSASDSALIIFLPGNFSSAVLPSPSAASAVNVNVFMGASSTVYLHLGTGEGSAATADLRIYGYVLN